METAKTWQWADYRHAFAAMVRRRLEERRVTTQGSYAR